MQAFSPSDGQQQQIKTSKLLAIASKDMGTLQLKPVSLKSGSFQMSQFFTSGGQSIGVSASTSSPSNEHPGLISFRMDWFDLLAVHGTLKSLLQHHSSKASILQCSAFFIVQLLPTSIHDYWKNLTLD